MKRNRAGYGFGRLMAACAVMVCGTVESIAGLALHSTLPLPGAAKDVEVRGTVAYVSTDSGLAAVDVSDPAKPRVKSFVRLPGHGNELTIFDKLAFITDGTGKAAQIVAVSDPGAMRLEGAFGDGCGYVWGIAGRASCRDTSAYVGKVAVASLSGVALFDVRLNDYGGDKYFGVILSRFNPYRYIKPPLPEDSTIDHLCDSCDSRGRWIKTDDVVLDGAFAYVLYYDLFRSDDRSYLCLKKVDLSDSSRPRCVDSLALHGFGCALAVSQGYAYVVHTGTWDMLPEMDIIDARAVPMTVVGSLRLPGAGEDVALAGKQAYVACGKIGVSVIDVSDPRKPVEEGSFKFCQVDTLGDAVAFGIATGNANVFVAAGMKGLCVLAQDAVSIPNRGSSRRSPGSLFRADIRSGTLGIRLSGDFMGSVSVDIHGLNGKRVLRRFPVPVKNGTCRLDCARPLRPGLFIVSVKREEKTVIFQKPFILQ